MTKNPERFFLRRHFNDFDELAESIQGWNLEFRKLDCGPFNSELMQLKSGSILQTLQYVSHSITEHPSTLDNPGLRHELKFEIPQQLLTLLSHAYPAKFRPLARHRSRALKQALTYITDYAEEPPTVLEICQAAGVSQRTLEYAFLERFSVTPKAYLQAYRLNKVHKALRRADPNAIKIIDVANNWGFWHMGQFARDYRKLFDELPSETLTLTMNEKNRILTLDDQKLFGELPSGTLKYST